MSLAQAVASYLNSWEGHSSLEPDNYIRVMDLLNVASIEEINTEMNALTQQRLWNESLIDIFHDELLDRIDTDTTFAISAINDGSNKPSVMIWIGFEESYLLTDEEGELIRTDDPNVSSYTLTNASFQEPVARKLIHLLIDGEVNVTINSDSIASIASRSNPKDKIDFQPVSFQSVTVPAQIRETPDFNLVKRIYLSLKKANPVIIDTYSDQLINQLIDYREARDIVEDNGDTFEGQLYLTGTEIEDMTA